jgi:hypothetical protein
MFISLIHMGCSPHSRGWQLRSNFYDFPKIKRPPKTKTIYESIT